MAIGARYQTDGSCSFSVWAPLCEEVHLDLLAPIAREVPMERDEGGCWTARNIEAPPGTRYRYLLDRNLRRPDPASFFQPEGVHGPSETVDHSSFAWHDSSWRGRDLESLIIYELHVGAFTPEGTFDSIIARLDDLAHMGITAIELMPVGQFPGCRNWGYDGAGPFAAQNSYGGPEGLKRLVNACHLRGLAVILDVVYNHLGPEGNYLRDFGPYFTDRYQTPWGQAVNFDGPWSDGVRAFFLENARSWFELFHIDALRLDAVHAVCDFSARHILQQLAEQTEEMSQAAGRPLYLIAESDLNDPRMITPLAQNGMGMGAQWSDDFHHCLHTLLTGERDGYYADFGSPDQLARALREGFVYGGEYSAFRKRSHGASSAHLPAFRFIVSAQNHDQVGNRMLGERLSSLAPFEALKLAAASVLLSPNIPLLFMGEEYGEHAPFAYFVDHGDADLIKAVREGRKQEFAAFGWKQEPPDPQSPETFAAACLSWGLRSGEDRHGCLHRWYQSLIALRIKTPALSRLDRGSTDILHRPGDSLIAALRRHDRGDSLCLFFFGPAGQAAAFSAPSGCWRKVLDSTESRWLGPGATLPETLSGTGDILLQPYTAAVYERKD